MGKHAKTKGQHRVASGPQATRPARTGGPSVAAPEAELRRGLVAFQRGDYIEAIQAWKQARRAGTSATIDKALAEAHFRRALATTNPARRAQEMQEAIALAPDRAIYRFHIGVACQRQGQLRRAVAALEEAHRLAPGDHRIARHLALLLLIEPESVARARDVLAGTPQDDEATARLRALLEMRENTPAAAVTTLAALKSPSPLATLSLGLAQLAAGQREAARVTLAKTLRSRKAASPEVRQAVMLANVIAKMQASDLGSAVRSLREQNVPGDAALRRTFAIASHQLAVELVLAERTEEAILAWQQVLAAEPDHDTARRCLGHLREVVGTHAARRGDFGPAAQQWQAALADQPSNVRLLRNLALAEERLERWPQASARWEALIRLWKKEQRTPVPQEEVAADLRPRLAVACRHLAATYEAADDFRAAARALERALNLDASDVELRLRAAELYLDHGEYGSAIEHLRRVLTSRPNDVRVLLELGEAYDLKGDDRQALTFLGQALLLEPRNEEIKATLASVHHGRGQRMVHSKLNEQAAIEFQRAIELAPGDPEHYLCLGGVYLSLGRPAAVEATFRNALALSPNDAKIRVAMGRLYLEHGDHKKAERLFRQALRLERSIGAYLIIGLTYLRQGHMATADRYLKHVLQGHEPDAMLVVGEALIDAGRESDAIRFLERAISLDPSSVDARIALALTLATVRHDYARAVAELSAAEAGAESLGDRRALRAIARIRETLNVVVDPDLRLDLKSPLGGW